MTLRKYVALAIFVTVFAAAALAQAPTEPSPAPEPAAAAGVELRFQNRLITVFRTNLGPITPRDRARAAERRLASIPPTAVVPTVKATRVKDSGVVFTVLDQSLFFLLPGDLDPAGDETLETATSKITSRLQLALEARHAMSDNSFVLRASITALGATIACLLLLILLQRWKRRVLDYIPNPGDPRFARFTFLGFHLGPYAVRVLERASAFIGIALQVLAVYLWLAFALTQFPTTLPWGEALDNYLIDTVKMLAWGALRSLPQLVTVLIIFLLTRFVARLVAAFFDAVEHRRISVGWLQPETANATRRILSVVVWVFGISVAYPYIPGADTAAFKGLSVFVGLMVSLGSAGLVNQVMSGLVVVYSRAFKPGDVIRVGEVEGLVSEIGVLSTKVLTRRREEITIPNAVLVGTTTTNFMSAAGSDGQVLSTSVTIGYDTPWRQVHALLLLAAERTECVRAEPRPFVLQTALSDFYAEYNLNVHLAEDVTRPVALSTLHANIQDAFNEFGVQIMSPNFEAQPEQKVWVPKDKWFDAPAKP